MLRPVWWRWALAVLAVLVLCTDICNASCPTDTYTAPYDLSKSPVMSVKSALVTTGVFYLQPCNSIDYSYCTLSNSFQTCYKEDGVYSSAGLGSPTLAKWSPIGGDVTWSQGASSVNSGNNYYDISDYVDCYSSSSNKVTINYICGPKGDNSVTLQQEPLNKNAACVFTFEVDSAIVCAAFPANNGGSGSAGGGGLSGGWIFIIILIVVSFVYLVLGVSFNHFKLGKTGAELIPNIGFWRNLPGLVRDGCTFTYTKLRSLLCDRGDRGSSGLATQEATGSYETI